MSKKSKDNRIQESRENFKLTDLLYNEKYILYSYHWHSYNQFMSDIITYDFGTKEYIFNEDYSGNLIIRYILKFENVLVKPAIDENANEEEIIFPETCRLKFLTYCSRIIADVVQIKEIVNTETAGIDTKSVERTIVAKEYGITVAKIPIMVRSDYCTTNIRKDLPNTECRFDPGCYFIVKGSEKVIIGLERLCENKMLCFIKKDINYVNNMMYSCQVSSTNYNYDIYNINTQIVNIKMNKDKSIIITIPQLNDIPLFILYRALGIETDNDILNYIANDNLDLDILNLLKISMYHSLSETIMNDNGEYIEIKTQADAEIYLINKLKNKKYTLSNTEININQRRKHLEILFMKDFLPHMGTTQDKRINKIYYLSKMVNKLLNTYLGKIDPDDRDSFVNKRIELPGTLMKQLFRQNFMKMLNDTTKFFKKKNNGNNENPINVIKFIKFSTIDQGLLTGLSTGVWTNKRKGVAQVLQRLTYRQFISILKRIMPPISDSAMKVVSIRHANNIQYGYIDAVETPDGQKCGIHKHLSLSCSVTVNQSNNHIENIKNILREKKYNNIPCFIELTDIPCNMIYKKVNIILNGELLGITEYPFELTKHLKLKRQNEINKQTSINFNIRTKSIVIFTDGGRLIRPLLTVSNNELKLNRDMLNNIDSNFLDKKKITRWCDFINKYPDVIEYIDIEESENLMVAMYVSDVLKANEMMNNSIIPSDGGRGNIINRYDKVYVKYTHCEFHPILALGVISSTIPFSEHNPSTRNAFSFGQNRQGISIYATNHRYRVDLSYLLYYPMRPLVTNKGFQYTNLDLLPAGQNVIVAIMMYTGHNQEDSLIMNETSIRRGMFISTTLKKYSDTITKNSSTGQDDIFMKPDSLKVSGMMDPSCYNKLNDKGYVPEETVIYNGDVIIGKVSPIQNSVNTTKIYKDESEIYKSSVPGTVDKVYTNLYNPDGYEMYNMQVRSERIPQIGDKFCCYDDSHEILTLLGWKNIKEISMDDNIGYLNSEYELEYDKTEEIYSYDYEGKMYVIETEEISLSVTPNHRMYVKEKDYKIEIAEEIVGERIYKTTNRRKEVINNKYFIYNDENIITHFKDYNYKIEEWLELISISINRNELSKYPEWVWYLSESLCILLVNYIVKDENKYETENKKLADEFQRLCLHANYYSTMEIEEKIIIYFDKTEKKEVLVMNSSYVQFSGKVYCCRMKDIGVLCIRRNNKITFCGNSQHGQKGTIGLLLSSADMPFTKDGIQPDIIINPCCMPTRKSIGQLFESIFSKVAALKGVIIDATPFDNFNIEEIYDELKSFGFDEHGNETLYCGMTGKKIESKIFIGITHYLKLKHMVDDKIHCLVLEHEILTLDGWKNYNELTTNDYVATLLDGNIEYQKINKIHYYEKYEGYLYEIFDENINLCVTDNHRMYVSEDNIKYSFEVVQDISEKEYYYSTNANNYEKEKYNLELDFILDTDAFIIYLAILINSKDHISCDNKIELNILNLKSYSDKEILKNKVDEILEILQYNKNSLSIINYLTDYKNNSKYCLPEWITKINKNQSQLFLNYLFFTHANNNIFNTESHVLADQIQQIALHAGFSAKISNQILCYSIHINYNNINLINKNNYKIYECNEPVFCIEVPNEIFYTRRFGIPSWTGNSRATGPRQRLTRQPPEGRSRDGGLRFGEMERDAIIAHGCSLFLKERLVDTSDIYTTYICSLCGLIAQKKKNKDLWYCHACNSNSTTDGEISYAIKIELPYCLKLLFQELMAINILPRIRV